MFSFKIASKINVNVKMFNVNTDTYLPTFHIKASKIVSLILQ